jgi:hypothetical protein
VPIPFISNVFEQKPESFEKPTFVTVRVYWLAKKHSELQVFATDWVSIAWVWPKPPSSIKTTTIKTRIAIIAKTIKLIGNPWAALCFTKPWGKTSIILIT